MIYIYVYSAEQLCALQLQQGTNRMQRFHNISSLHHQKGAQYITAMRPVPSSHTEWTIH